MRHDAIDTCRPSPVNKRRAAMESSQVMARFSRTAIDREAGHGTAQH